ncbi:MAG TPA: hypothetical protein VNP92_01320, partial [Actinophytocola sp.]|nr:hypothetical protein [Actinophytocola sp.]
MAVVTVLAFGALSGSQAAATTTAPVAGSVMSSAAVRPRMRSPSDATTCPASTMASMVRPFSVPQSSVVMMQSCATSTSRR